MTERANRTDASWLAVLTVCALFASSCTHAATSREVKLTGFVPHVSQIELQQAVERYATLFVERASWELEPLATQPDYVLADHALRMYVRYASSALEVASGQQPELNVLDLLVFVVLTRVSVETYWLPKVFGDGARPLLTALQTSERELWAWSEGVLAEQARRDLRALIERWLEAHPAPRRVEWIRFTEFASLSANVERSRTASGILASVRAATHTADAALLLSERAMFVAQRMPGLMRVHARLGAREMFADGVQRMTEVDALLQRSEALLQHAAAMRPVIQQLEPLSASFARTLGEARALTVELEELSKVAGPLLGARTGPDDGPSTGVEQLISSTRELSESAQKTMRQARELAEGAAGLSAEGSARLHQLVRSLAVYALLVGVLWTTIFCAGYYLTRRLADDRAAARRERDEP